MTQYALIKNGTVAKIGLPRSWSKTDEATGEARALTTQEWIKNGYLPLLPAPAFDPATEKLVPIPQSAWVIGTDSVGPTYEVALLTQDELDARAAAEQAALIASYSDAIQNRLDSKAQERQYDNILSAVTYLGDPNPRFAAEAEALRLWRSDTWATSLVIMGEVLAGNRPAPSVEDLFAELPAFEWPVL